MARNLLLLGHNTFSVGRKTQRGNCDIKVTASENEMKTPRMIGQPSVNGLPTNL